MKPFYPAAAAIADYRRTFSSCTQASASEQRRRLNALALAIAEARGELWTLETYSQEHYVYVYLDPRHPGDWRYTLPSGRVVHFAHRPFYVGKGKGTRYKHHLTHCDKSHKVLTLNKIRAAGYDPRDYVFLSRYFSGVSDFMAQAYEVDLIAGIGRADLGKGPLTNHTFGGEGGAGAVHTRRDRARKSASQLKRWKRLGMGLLITHNGQTHTIPKWSKILGIPDITLYGRWRDGVRDPTKLLHVGNLRKLPNGKTLTYAGETLTITQWGSKLGMNRNVIANRLRAGQSIASALGFR